MNVPHQNRTTRPISIRHAAAPPAPRPAMRRALLACIGPLMLLGGCEAEDPNGFAPVCAPVGILAEAADFTDYGPGATMVPDLSRLVSQGSIVGVSGQCTNIAGGTQLHTVIRVQLAVTRGPVGSSSSLSVPYFYAVTRDGAVVDKQSLVALAQFPDNGDRVLVRTDPVTLDLPVTRAHPSTSYRIEVGFQLTPQQLAYNRAHLPR